MKQTELYQQVTDRIIEKLEAGVSPWRKPWRTQQYHGLPINVASRRAYRGVNVWLLWLAALEHGWSSGIFGTYLQWQELGGHVQRGEKGTKIVFWNAKTESTTDDETGDEEQRLRFFARQFSVFALEQCGGDVLASLNRPEPQSTDFIDFAPAEQTIAATGADIRFGGNQAFYSPTGDFIQMPVKDSFGAPAEYYSTALHELCHWTGHPNRLNRLDKLARFGDRSYAMEELVAEMGAAFLTASLGVPNTSTDNSASYLGDWLQVLRADSRAIFTASSAASKAADHVLSFSRELAESEPALVI